MSNTASAALLKINWFNFTGKNQRIITCIIFPISVTRKANQSRTTVQMTTKLLNQVGSNHKLFFFRENSGDFFSVKISFTSILPFACIINCRSASDILIYWWEIGRNLKDWAWLLSFDWATFVIDVDDDTATNDDLEQSNEKKHLSAIAVDLKRSIRVFFYCFPQWVCQRFSQ